MSENILLKIPALRRGFRFQFEPAQQCHVLLYPEGMIKLNDSASEILKRVDGARTVGRHHRRPAGELPDGGRYRRRHPGVPGGGR